jgi:hypothetical protein
MHFASEDPKVHGYRAWQNLGVIFRTDRTSVTKNQDCLFITTFGCASALGNLGKGSLSWLARSMAATAQAGAAETTDQ